MTQLRIVPRSLFSVEIPLPPSVNNLFATVKGRRIKSRAYKAWLAVAVPMLLALRKPHHYPAKITVDVVGEMNAARDLDNLLKPVGDALVEAGVIPGDSVKYVRQWEIAYWPDTGTAAVVVSVAALEARS